MAKAKPTPAAEAIADGVALVAVEPIRLDGSDIAPGATFSARASVAEELLAGGAAVLPKTPYKPASAFEVGGVGVGITAPEKIAPEAGATPGNGGSE